MNIIEGYVTVQGIAHHEDIAWREEDGHPIFFRTREEAQKECDIDYEERLKTDADATGDDKDWVSWAIQISNKEYEIYDLPYSKELSRPTFIYNIENHL